MESPAEAAAGERPRWKRQVGYGLWTGAAVFGLVGFLVDRTRHVTHGSNDIAIAAMIAAGVLLYLAVIWEAGRVHRVRLRRTIRVVWMLLPAVVAVVIYLLSLSSVMRPY